MPHIHTEPGQIDITVSVFIVHQNKVLLRFHDKYDFWYGPGGHIELNEDPNQAVKREAKEEVGLDIVLHSDRELPPNEDTPDGHKQLVAPVFINRHYITPEHEHVDMVFFATSKTDKLVLEKETDQCRWVSKEELLENKLGVRGDIHHYALASLQTLGEGA